MYAATVFGVLALRPVPVTPGTMRGPVSAF